jgi:hypothetical protein
MSSTATSLDALRANGRNVNVEIANVTKTASVVSWTLFGVFLVLGIAMLIPGAIMLDSYKKGTNTSKGNLAGGITLVVLGGLFTLGSIAPLVTAVTVSTAEVELSTRAQ